MTPTRTAAGVLAAGLVVLTAGGSRAAQRQVVPPRMGAAVQMGMPLGLGPGLNWAQLGVTDAQRQQIRAIIQQNRANLQPLRQRERAARAALVAAETAEPLDEGAIRARVAELAVIQGDLAVARAQLRASLLQVLTPEQQERVRQRRTQMLNRRQQAPGT